MEAKTPISEQPAGQSTDSAPWTNAQLADGLQQLALAQQQAAAEQKRDREESARILRLLQEQLGRLSGLPGKPIDTPNDSVPSADSELARKDSVLRRKPLPDPAKFSGEKDEYGV
ncbi:hypothetical protein CSAL01_13580 [Colletotrichum salicis]|uniref:Uncharacterized protein n=1 Tax=Colletotrichum salicis TaxID=1209931 RepID=A0A135V1J6_9PEZI|nr:hypothetical protein CSAL01_13580 [Colletotrichum salicis]